MKRNGKRHQTHKWNPTRAHVEDASVWLDVTHAKHSTSIGTIAIMEVIIHPQMDLPQGTTTQRHCRILM